MKTLRTLLFGGIGLLMISGSSADERLVKEILPSDEESAWQQIGWRTDLWEARNEANRTGKPIYLWEMDGHPLGCV